MCNIAGHAGKKAVAPILIEMLKRQQHFDGAGSAGIATIYNRFITHFIDFTKRASSIEL